MPGPGTYYPGSQDKIVGFVIHKPIEEKDDEDDKKDEEAPPPGPQSYQPDNPCFTAAAFKFPTGERLDLSAKMVTPGAPAYVITSEFDKIKEKPKFNMGIRTNQKGVRTQDLPGPGEYETDIVPTNQAIPAHVIGTSQRSDLGVGKAYLMPGPGQYNVRGKNDGAKIGFGTEKKKTKVKKTYAPGPGSYNLPGTIGNVPKYLLAANSAAATRQKKLKRQLSEY